MAAHRLRAAPQDTDGVQKIRSHCRHSAPSQRAIQHASIVSRHSGSRRHGEARRDIIPLRRDKRRREVRIVTTDSAAVQAVHAFIAFQRGEHHSGGHGGH